MRVKICGITRLTDALAAIEAGASAVGFIFVPSSKRFIKPEDAAAIIRQIPPFVTAVGVFANAERGRINEVLQIARVTALQFHGKESPDDTKGYPVPVYKAFRVSESFNPSVLGNYPGPAYLLDTHVDGTLGGTGKTFDWAIAVRAKEYGRIILAGGINPDNVEDAIRQVEPYAIDVCSGVEETPGKKSHERLRMLFSRIYQAEARMH
jgi:phosphoribosylanthranilate isomerase